MQLAHFEGLFSSRRCEHVISLLCDSSYWRHKGDIRLPLQLANSNLLAGTYAWFSEDMPLLFPMQPFA